MNGIIDKIGVGTGLIPYQEISSYPLRLCTPARFS